MNGDGFLGGVVVVFDLNVALCFLEDYTGYGRSVGDGICDFVVFVVWLVVWFVFFVGRRDDEAIINVFVESRLNEFNIPALTLMHAFNIDFMWLCIVVNIEELNREDIDVSILFGPQE